MELKHDSKQVLSPKRYLSKEQRAIPRNDSRKQALKSVIIESLFMARHHDHFERLMKQRGYKIERGRGIAFIDPKGVRIKGSAVNYALVKSSEYLGTKRTKHNLRK